MSILYEKLKTVAQKKPQMDAVVFYGKRYSYAKIFRLVEKTAGGLKAVGVKKGSVVTLCVPNTPSAMIAFYALNRLGAVINLVHPFVSADGFIQSVIKTDSKIAIAYDLFLIDNVEELNKGLVQLGIDIKIFESRSEHFMGALPKLYFKIFKRFRKPSGTAAKPAKRQAKRRAKRLGIKYPIFEDLFKNPEISLPPENINESQPAVYLPSGGTAGIPKIIAHRAGVFNELCDLAQYFLSEPLENYSAMYSVLPIFHGFGLCMSMHMCVVVGVKNVMSMKFNPKDVTKAIQKERVNVIMGVPTMFEKLLNSRGFSKKDLSSLKDCFVGGDSVPKGLVEDFNDALDKRGFKGRLYIGYGLTETVAACVVNCLNCNKKDSIGYPLPGVEVAVVKDGNRLKPFEIGEICIKTPLVMLNYLEDGEIKDCETTNEWIKSDDKNGKTKDSGTESGVRVNDCANLETPQQPIKDFEGGRWLFTGDLGFVDDDGFLFFKQRAKNMIKVKGVPVFPCEIEAVAESLPWVVRSAAIGVPDKGSGECVKLYVEIHSKKLPKLLSSDSKKGKGKNDNNGEAADHATLKKIIIGECEKKLIRYAVPRIIEIRESLPLNLIGKIDRKKLS